LRGRGLGVRGQRSPQVQSSSILPIAFADHEDKDVASAYLGFFAPGE
jgi:hypothetical protein